MSIFKCKMCGGTLEIKEGTSVCTCDYCGTKQTVSTTKDEGIQNLFNRANTLRIKSEFDRAAELYEKIIQNSENEAEAYWGLILCKYGIEYVEDPKTFKRIPTCHRASYDTVKSDPDFKSAVKYADEIQKKVYRDEATAIDKIQKGIIALAQKEDPYDVFICYKESDENGKRTQDSAIANDIYHQLTQEGFKVFYAAITLEDKLGSDYEPHIFSALNTAKVMLAIGTKPEYFNAVWVKNEWSRFMKILKKDRTKLLIPCYRDMDPYELPDEFAHLQAQDMGKIGFINDLVRGIKKVIEKAEVKPKETVKETVVVSASNPNITPLLERGFLFLEDGKWQDADIYCEKVLDIDSKNAEAYLGKLMAELQVKTRKQLAECAEPFDDRDNYNKVIRFGDEKLEAEIRGYIMYIREQKEETRLAEVYENTKSRMQRAKTEDEYRKLANVFESISSFRDAGELAKACLDKSKDKIYTSAKEKMAADRIVCYEEAIKIFQTISDWNDSEEQILICRKRIDEKAAEYVIKAKRRKRAFAIGGPIICAIIAFLIVLTTVIIPASKYNKAISLLNDGEIVDAYESLVALNGYKDSTTKANEIFAQYKIEKMKIVTVGDIVYFGSYEQDNNTSNGKEDIEWRVLAKEDNKILLISEYALDCQQYNTFNNNVTWETCSLRKWMNDTFMNNAFSTEEQSQIQSTSVSADKNPNYSTNPGKATTDQVFLLSITEAEKYFTSDTSRQCKPTEYAVAKGVFVSQGNGNSEWWLRSPDDVSNDAASVSCSGWVDCDSYHVDVDHNGVRPALWITREP